MNHQILDEEVVDQLFMFDDEDDSFSKNMIVEFKKQAKDTSEQLAKSIACNDYEDVKRAAHFLKGSAISMGGVEVPNICAQIEAFPEKVSKEMLQLLNEAISRYLSSIHVYQSSNAKFRSI